MMLEKKKARRKMENSAVRRSALARCVAALFTAFVV
jgi:hypothetical protein